MGLEDKLREAIGSQLYLRDGTLFPPRLSQGSARSVSPHDILRGWYSDWGYMYFKIPAIGY